MNTRLQVEHPVTEEITGLDLVEQMIRVAAGEKLTFTQDDVKLDGWAIETRVYAEDPVSRVPAEHRPARIALLAARRAADEAGRQDPSRGCTASTTASPRAARSSMFYDPMIAKLITWAPTREAAIDAQVAALDAFQIDGIGRQCRFPVRADAAPALPRRRAHHRLHRRGISRRLPRRAGRRAAARRSGGDRRDGRADHARTRAAQIRRAARRPIEPPSERSRADRRATMYRVAIEPYEGGKLAIVDGGERST